MPVAVVTQVEAAFHAVTEAWGRVDVLVNNAGTFGPAGDVDEIPVDGWLDTVAVNLTGSFLCARAAFAQMKRQEPRGGPIINNGSISAHTPRPGQRGVHRHQARDHRPHQGARLDGRAHDIAVGQIDIGNAATGMALQRVQGEVSRGRLAAAGPAAQQDRARLLVDRLGDPSHDCDNPAGTVR